MTNKKDYRISVRVEQEDFERLERLRDLFKKRKGRSVRVTQRTVIVEALMCLEQRSAELEKDRIRKQQK